MFSQDLTINIKNRNINIKIEKEEFVDKPEKKKSTIFEILCCCCIFCFDDDDYYN
jgi:hypothetical protein